MQHVAIDRGSMESQICVRQSDGQISFEGKVPTASLKARLRGQPKSRVIVETCAEAFRVAEFAMDFGREVRVVPATLVRSLGVGARRIKTDRRDAQVLSEVSCRIDLPSVHVPTHLARQRRSMCGMREELIASRTALINCVRGWARTQLLKIRSGDVVTFPKRARDAALKSANGLPEHASRLLKMIEALTEQISVADSELQELAAQDVLCQRLMTVPGIGPVSSLRFAAALDDCSRFASAHAVQGYLGLTPGENSSSQRQQRTGITKAGPAPVRRLLVQAAWNFRRLCPNDSISVWASEVEKRRGKFVATVAVARKLAGVLYAIWRDGSKFEPNHNSKAGNLTPS
jgi:transposase